MALQPYVVGTADSLVSLKPQKAASKRRLTDRLLNETFHLAWDQRGVYEELLGLSVENALRLAHHTAPNSMKASTLKRARFPKRLLSAAGTIGDEILEFCALFSSIDAFADSE